ncbi:hypothetical protein YC2023_119429 [Brassica napus]|uniref:(rape) hypothetical protein n=1 Tax=Brassica napus TaxID=3708 RepID=A0A816J4A6_BRANA|nr:unnamed protein product [Brassica napus]
MFSELLHVKQVLVRLQNLVCYVMFLHFVFGNKEKEEERGEYVCSSFGFENGLDHIICLYSVCCIVCFSTFRNVGCFRTKKMLGYVKFFVERCVVCSLLV